MPRLNGMELDKEGHRGCRGLMPENTIPGFLKAVEFGVSTLEMDAVVSRDNQVILSHDQWFNADITTKPNGKYILPSEEKNYNLYKMDYADIKAYDVGLKRNPAFPYQQNIAACIPKLADVIDTIEYITAQTGKKPVYYNIETKCQPSYDNIYNPPPDKFIELIMKIVMGKGIANRVIIQSFDMRTLKYLHQHYPEIKTALLVGDNALSFAEQLDKLGFVPTIYSPSYELVNSQLVKQCHDKNIRLITWTVNDKTTISRFDRMGVDGIITDYPDMFY